MTAHIDNKMLCPLRFLCMCWVVAIACSISQRALAHTSLEHYVRESLFISVGTENVDVKIQFSFPASLSLVERKFMDQDGNGTLSKEEQGNYLKNIQARAEKQLRFSINGQSTMLIPLEEPVLDLQDTQKIEAHPHELRLAYFARLPQTFGVGGTFTLDSGLWPDMPLLISVSFEGEEGIRFQMLGKQGLRQPSTNDTSSSVIEARCTQWNPGSKKNGRK